MPRFGLFLPQIRMPFDRMVERTLAAEAAGFDSVWFIDHLWASGAEEMELLDGWTVASAVAARTATIRIGHLVLCDTFRHPAVLAKMAATLDVVSGGRFELGLGWGSTMDEFEAFGIEPRDAVSRAGRLGETLEVLRRLFTGERVSFAGEFFHLDGAMARPVPLQDPLPIHLGGGGPRRTLPLVREYATGWNCPSYAVDRLAELRPLAGDVEVSVQHPIALVASEAERADVEAVAARRFAGWGGLLVGTPDEVAASLAAEARLGVDRFIVQLWDFGRPESIDWFAREVMPAVG